MTPISPTLANAAVSRTKYDDFHNAVAGSIASIHPSGLRNRMRRTHNRRALDRMQRGKRG